jgi:hypothetical protein
MIYDPNATNQKRIFLKANKPHGLSFSIQLQQIWQTSQPKFN